MVRCAARLTAISDQAASLLEAARALVAMVQVWEREGTNMSPSATQQCFDHWVVFLRHTAEVEDVHIPKRHLVAHLLSQMAQFGNPRRYSTWRDESLNRVFKAACRTTSQVTFECCVLNRMKELLSKESQTRKRARE